MTVQKSLLTFLTTIAVTSAATLVFSSSAHAQAKPTLRPSGPSFRIDVRVECEPEIPDTFQQTPLRTDWNTELKEIQKVIYRSNGIDSALELKLRYVDSFKPTSTSTPVERVTSDAYNFVPEAGAQTLLMFINTKGRNVKFESVQFMFGNIDSPPTEGPLPEGSWPAKASLILVNSAHYLSPKAKTAPAVVTNVPLNCTYHVKY